ncbi:rhomboid family intramembrane serine protease [Dinghuibacter silviterrae]|uniref:Rhomboid family protein n=1 Tax=Dinghuibacter silviterrae TaxID=1539049 RepID=A0A4R8DGX4_9BACT|nr:rhomboid family intramembrane serine protease [Dinghuibacter silviterrae]TDW96775.1 rhomboid family protein [Dinghuibacter silviterrae]
MTITIGIIILTALISLTSFSNPKAIDDLSMWPVKIDQKKQYYRFITSGFIHGDLMHLFFNMFTLYFFGTALEETGVFSAPVLILFYLTAIVVSDIPSYIKHRRSYGYRSIGASGAVSAFLFATILFDPWMKIGIFGIIPVPGILYAVLYTAYCVYSSRRRADNINHDAHLWGGLYGWVFVIILVRGVVPFFLNQLMHPPI